MNNILSNRFFQGASAIAAIAIAIFAYQNVTADDAETTAAVETESTTMTEAAANVTATSEKANNATQEAVNNTTETDNMNSTAGEEAINND